MNDFEKMMRQMMMLQSAMIKGFEEVKSDIAALGDAVRDQITDSAEDFEPLDSMEAYFRMKSEMTPEKMSNLVSAIFVDIFPLKCILIIDIYR